MNTEFESIVAEAVREGFVVESQTGSTVVIAKRRRESIVWIVLRLVAIVFFTLLAIAVGQGAPAGYLMLLIPAAIVVLWIVAARKPPIRFLVTVDENGDPVQEPIR